MLHSGTSKTDHIHKGSMRKLVRTYVDEDLLTEWRAKHGSYAAESWLLETAMRQTLDLTKKDPSLTELVGRGIRSHILEQQAKRPNAIKSSDA